MTTEILTIDTDVKNSLNGKSIEVHYDERGLSQDVINDIHMDALADLETPENGADFHDWLQHGCFFTVKKIARA